MGNRPLPSIWFRWIVYGAAWLPFSLLLVFNLPQFTPVLEKLEGADGLPVLTRGLLWVGNFNQQFLAMPLLCCFVLVIFADVGVANFVSVRSRSVWIYWAWFASVLLLGVAAIGIYQLAVMLPVFEMPANVK